MRGQRPPYFPAGAKAGTSRSAFP